MMERYVVCVCVYVCMDGCVCVCVWMGVYVCLCVCVYVIPKCSVIPLGPSRSPTPSPALCAGAAAASRQFPADDPSSQSLWPPQSINTRAAEVREGRGGEGEL